VLLFLESTSLKGGQHGTVSIGLFGIQELKRSVSR